MKIFFGILILVSVVGCKTKSEIRREQEFERLKLDVRDARGTKADIETVSEDIRRDISRLGIQIEEQNQYLKNQDEEIRRDLSAISARLLALEQKAIVEETAAKQQAERPKNYETAKALFDEGHFDESIEMVRAMLKQKPKGEEAKKGRYLMAEAYFASKDYASAVLEYSEFKKLYPRDKSVPQATYSQAQAFRLMGKKQEAKLFYQELMDRFPKSPLAAKAKQEMRLMKNGTDSKRATQSEEE